MTVKNWHQKASELSQNALVKNAEGHYEEAIALYQQAFVFEKNAAMLLAEKLDKEPTRGILFRSAAYIAIKGHLYREAEQMAAYGLAGNPDETTMQELREALILLLIMVKYPAVATAKDVL